MSTIDKCNSSSRTSPSSPHHLDLTGPIREKFNEEQREESERKRLQRETEERIETSFLFSAQAHPRVELLFDRHGFLFPR
jgi:hypothetical protein